MLLFLRRSLSVLLWLALVPVLVAVIAAPFVVPVVAAKDAVAQWWDEIPEQMVDPVLPQRSTIVDAQGNFLAEVYLYNRQVVPSSKISPLIKKAVVATEDKRFYEHPGVDFEGLGRAVVVNLKAGAMVQGGSGITQQYVKNLAALADLNGRPDEAWQAASERSIDRKVREARMAMALERRMDKDSILTGYLNTALFGNGAYGIEAAARYYFDKGADAVTLPEAALLAGLLQSPSAYDPIDHPELAKKRRSVVLSRMLDAGVITDDEYAAAVDAPLPTEGHAPPGRCPQSYAPFYCGWVTEQLLSSPMLGNSEEDRRRRLAQGGLVIHTALDPKVQKAADKAIARVPAGSRVASAIAMVEPGTGNVRALATSRHWGGHTKQGETELLLPTREAFQIGSTFKAFTLASALDMGLDPDMILPAGVTYKSKVFRNPEKGYFSNYSATPWHDLSLRDAAKWSVNTAFIQLQEKVGTRRLAQVAHDLGLTNLPLKGDDRIRANEGSLTLGARETSVLNVANGYASLAAGGVACPATGVTGVTHLDGTALEGITAPHCSQVVSPAAAAMTTDILASVVTDGTGANAALPDRPIAGKTGTTNNSAAVWFAGYVPQLAAAVWIGDPRGPSFSVDGALGIASMTGGSVPAEIWRNAMSRALRGTEPLPLAGATHQSLFGGPTHTGKQKAGLPVTSGDQVVGVDPAAAGVSATQASGR